MIMVSAQSDTLLLSPEEIVTLIPNKVKEFYSGSDAKSRLIKLGNIRYSMVERNFVGNRNRSIKILLFDYKEAPIMYNQATRQWNSYKAVESDSLILRPTLIKDCTGWESYNVHRKDSQILLGICNRFFLSAEGKNVDLEFLKKVVMDFKLNTFPK